MVDVAMYQVQPAMIFPVAASLIALAAISWAILQFAMDGLPILGALTLGTFAHRHGVGIFEAVILGVVCLVVLSILEVQLDLTTRTVARRCLVALFTTIAALAGYCTVQIMAPPLVGPVNRLSLIAGVIVGAIACWRAATSKPDPEDLCKDALEVNG